MVNKKQKELKELMMGIRDNIKTSIVAAVKTGDTSTRDALKYLLGCLEREYEKHLTDEQIIAIFKKVRGKEIEVLALKKELTSKLLETIDHFLPSQVTEEEIKNWINTNINFDNYKNKMHSIKDVVAYFGGRTNGNVVKQVLLKIKNA